MTGLSTKCHNTYHHGGRVLAVNAGARAPRGGVTRQGVVLTDLFSHFVIVNKTSLTHYESESVEKGCQPFGMFLCTNIKCR
jgi:hypothetical protein